MKSGIYYDMPEAEYFSVIAASNSTLGRMKRSPAHCKEYMDSPMEQTASMRLGSIVHKLTLEGGEAFAAAYYVAQESDPAKPRKQQIQAMIDAELAGGFTDQFFIDNGEKVNKPRGAAGDIAETLLAGDLSETVKLFASTPTNLNMRTKEGKADYAEFQAKCEREGLTICKQEDLDKACEYANWVLELGDRELVSKDDALVARNYAAFLGHVGEREVITQDEADTAAKIRDSIMAHPSASRLLDGGSAEVSAFWTDSGTGFPCKCRFDFINDMGYIVDLKTTQDASLSEFSRSIAKFGYHRQNAMYFDGHAAVTGTPAKGFVFIAVETKPPYAVGVYNLDLDGVDKGREEYQTLLADFKKCTNFDEWPAYSEQVETIELPRWYQ